MSTTRTYESTRAQLQTKFDAHGTYPLKVMLVTGYVYNEGHAFVDDILTEITTGSVTRLTLSSVTSTVTDGVWIGDAADPTWTGVTFTDADAIIIFADEGADSASPVLGCIDFAPTDVTAGDFTVTFASTGLFRVSDDAPTGTTTLAALTDVDVTTVPPSNLDSLMWNAADSKWEPGVPATASGFTVGTFTVFLAADAIDGTGNEFEVLSYMPSNAGAGIRPAGWTPTELLDAAGLAVAITSMGGSARAVVYSSGAWSVRTVTTVDLGDPWPEVAGDVFQGGDSAGGLRVAIDSGEMVLLNPSEAEGILAGTMSSTKALAHIEGHLDGVRHVGTYFEAAVTGLATLMAGAVADIDQPTGDDGRQVAKGDFVATLGDSFWIHYVNPSTGQWSTNPAGGTAVPSGADAWTGTKTTNPLDSGYMFIARSGVTGTWMGYRTGTIPTGQPAKYGAPASTGEWVLTGVAGGGTGDMVGPASATANRIFVADGGTGKLAKMPSTDIDAGTQKITGVVNPTSAQHAATKDYVDTADALKAPLASPTFTGTPAAPPPSAADNSTKLATTAYVDRAVPVEPDPMVGYTGNGYGYFVPGGLVLGSNAGAVVSVNRNQNELWTFDEDMTIVPAMEWAAASAAGKLARLWVCSVTAGTWQPVAVVHDFGTIATDSAANTATEWASHTFTRGNYLARWVTDGGATFKGVTTIPRGAAIGGSSSSASTIVWPNEGASSSGAVSATNTTAFTYVALTTQPNHRIKVRRV